MPGQASKAKQVSRLGESPAEARKRMSESAARPDPDARTGGGTLPPIAGVPLKVSAELEGFGGPPVDGNEVQEQERGDSHAPSPTAAVNMLRELGNQNNQLKEELSAAFGVIELYKSKFGELD